MNVRLDGIMVWVENVSETVDFYMKAFGFEVVMMSDEKDYAQMKTGETTLAFAHEGAALTSGVAIQINRASNDAPAIQLALVAEDVDTAFARALEAGAMKVVDIVEKPWGQRLGYVRDLNGLLVELSSPAAW